MVIHPPDRAARIDTFLNSYLLKMHFSNKFITGQVIHTPTAIVACFASSQEKLLRQKMEVARRAHSAYFSLQWHPGAIRRSSAQFQIIQVLGLGIAHMELPGPNSVVWMVKLSRPGDWRNTKARSCLCSLALARFRASELGDARKSARAYHFVDARIERASEVLRSWATATRSQAAAAALAGAEQQRHPDPAIRQLWRRKHAGLVGHWRRHEKMQERVQVRACRCRRPSAGKDMALVECSP